MEDFLIKACVIDSIEISCPAPVSTVVPVGIVHVLFFFYSVFLIF